MTTKIIQLEKYTTNSKSISKLMSHSFSFPAKIFGNFEYNTMLQYNTFFAIFSATGQEIYICCLTLHNLRF